MQNIIRIMLFALLCANLSGMQAQKRQNLTDMHTVRYEPTDEDFPNPERGFHTNTDLLKTRDLRWARQRGYSLVRGYVLMADFRDKPLSDKFLDDVRAGFAAARQAGVKILPIFAYNFPTDEDIKSGRVKNSPDAPLPLVLQHIKQLEPVWKENADVIAALELGFVGAWGEWHSSGNKLDTPENKKTILKAILKSLPKDRMMQIRYPADLMANYPVPLTEKQAFSSSYQARTGFANMCFLSNESDSGTYLPIETKPAKQRYIEQMCRYVVVGGETCQITPEQNRTDATVALAEFERFHFSYINMDFYQPTVEKWKKEGALAIIARKLGYRFRLVEGSFPRSARAGARLECSLSLRNEGWASPYNPRGIELILRHKSDGAHTRIPLHIDPRRLYPGAKDYKFGIDTSLPAGIKDGEYELLLNLPDPAPSLMAKPEYSIRLANKDVWEASTGFNRLLAKIQVVK